MDGLGDSHSCIAEIAKSAISVNNNAQGGRLMISSDAPDSFRVLLREADEIRALKESNRAAINTLFGVVLPVTVTVFEGLYSKDC